MTTVCNTPCGITCIRSVSKKPPTKMTKRVSNIFFRTLIIFKYLVKPFKLIIFHPFFYKFCKACKTLHKDIKKNANFLLKSRFRNWPFHKQESPRFPVSVPLSVVELFFCWNFPDFDFYKKNKTLLYVTMINTFAYILFHFYFYIFWLV